MGGRIFIAKDAGTTTIDGKEYSFQAGVTRVAEGHLLLDQIGHHFKPVDDDLTFPLEAAVSRSGRRGPTVKKTAESEETAEEDSDADGDHHADVPVHEEASEAQDLSEVDLSAKTRPELNEIAVRLGVEKPEELVKKAAVVEAIEAAIKPKPE